MKERTALCMCGCRKPAPIAKRTGDGYQKGETKRFLPGHGRHKPLDDRFWSKVNKNGPMHPVLQTPCWLWMGTPRTDQGYGRVQFQGVVKVATHVAWYMTHGVWPTEQMCHRCDNTQCVNPDHLFEGNQQDNITDKVSKSRQARGQRHGRAKLSPQDVLDIRRLYSSGAFTYRSLGKRFGVDPTAIGLIIRKHNWAHLGGAQ
jgi:hypothetical protein